MSRSKRSDVMICLIPDIIAEVQRKLLHILQEMEGDIDVSKDIYNTKDINYDKNDGEALNGSDVEPLSLNLSESEDEGSFIFSDNDPKCNDRDENYSGQPNKVAVQTSIAPEPILDINMNSNSESLFPVQPPTPEATEGIKSGQVEGVMTFDKVCTLKVPEVEESVCFICGVSVLEGDDYQCHLQIVHNELSEVPENGVIEEKDEVQDVPKEAGEIIYEDLIKNQASQKLLHDNQTRTTGTAQSLKCYFCDLGMSRLNMFVKAESFHLQLARSGKLGTGNPSKRNVFSLASYLCVSPVVAQQVLEHLGVCKETDNNRNRLSFIRRMCWDNINSLSDLCVSFEHVWRTVDMLKDAHEISQEILGQVYTWKCLFRNDSYFKTFLREICIHIHHGKDRKYTFTRNMIVEVVDLETESDITDPVVIRSDAITAQPEQGETPGVSPVTAPPVPAHQWSKKRLKSSDAPYTKPSQEHRPPSYSKFTSSFSESQMHGNRLSVHPPAPDTSNNQFLNKSLNQQSPALLCSPHRHHEPQQSLQTLAQALLDLGNQRGRKRTVQMRLTEGQIKGLWMLAIMKI